jgi:hypothetical protein
MNTKLRLLPAAAVLGACFAAATPAFGAQADWQEYVYEEFGLAKEFPLPPRRSQSVYAAPETSRDTPRIAGSDRISTLFETELDDIIYRMEIVDISDAVDRSANIFSECLYLSEQAGEEVSNVHMGVGGEDSEVYGRLAAVELYEEQGHLLTACFYNGGYLVRVDAHILPENGNSGSPQAYRYVSTIRFDLSDSYEQGE